MKKLAGLLLLIVGLTLTIGAGANFRYYEAERSITVNITSDDNEFIDLTPLQPYAYLNNGKLTVEMSPSNPNYPYSDSGYGRGMSVNTIYVFEEMFSVSNELWENENGDFPICVHISLSDGDGIEFFAGNYDNPIGGPGTHLDFTVYHDEPVPVGFVFNNTDKEMGTQSVQMSIIAEAGACDE